MMLSALAAGISGCATDSSSDTRVAAAVVCPEGTTQKGALPPEGRMIWCERTSDGIKHGPWMSGWKDGNDDDAPTRASEGEYVDGILHGPYRAWFKGGTKAQMELDTHKGDGKVTVRDEQGTDLFKVAYSNGQPIRCPGTEKGDRTTERVVWCESDKDGESVKHGRLVTYYGNGDIESMMWYAHGELQGRFTAFHDDGSPWIEGEYINGKRHGHWVTWPKK